MGSAKDEFFNKVHGLKKEVEAKKDAVKSEDAVTSQDSVANLAVKDQPDLVKMYNDNASVGSENLGGQSPQLKIHATGRSTTNVLADGGEPNDGYFFYVPTGEQFKEIECHILTISKGYRADGLDRKNVFNQIMAGVIINGGAPRPFIMYMSGMKLQRMWDFGTEAGKYRKAKPLSIPMFALRVKLTTEKVVAEYKPGMKTNVWVIKFEIMKNEDGLPVLVSDTRTFSYLKNQVDEARNTIAAIIEARGTDELTPVSDLPEGEPVDPGVKVLDEGHRETVNPDDIPF